MTFGRVVFVIVLLIVLWHFKDSLPIDRSSGDGVVAATGRGSPATLHGTFLMQEIPGEPHYVLKFVDDSHVQVSTDGKLWSPAGTYRIFDDKLYLYLPNAVWNMEIRGQTLYNTDHHWTFIFVPNPLTKEAGA